MAIELSHEHMPGLIIDGTYWIVGDIALGVFDETVRVTFRGYLNEAARRQQSQPGELAELEAAAGSSEGVLNVIRQKWARYHRPIDDATISVSIDDYRDRIQPALANLLDAIYALAKEQPEPFGLANHFATGKDI